jgi:hypothetical protein
VTVVVIPTGDEREPQASAGLREAVCRYLDERRLLTVELYVKGPQYREVKVEAKLSAQPYASSGAVQRKAIEALDTALHPLRRPLGNSFYPTTIYTVLQEVPEVVAVESLKVWIDGQLRDDLGQPVHLGRDEAIFSSAGHEIHVRPGRES